ncbi:MAG: ribonuclease [Phenylobacterium sp.]|nr:ribonuclease [Phenylobacterium sp.]
MATGPEEDEGGGGSRLAGAALRAAPWAGMAAFALLWMRARRGRAPASLPAEALPALYEAIEPGRGRIAEAPPQIPARGWKDVLWRTWLEVGRDRLPATAGGVTFYALLAIFPAIGAFVSLYGLFADVGAVSRQLAELAAFVPRGALTLVAEQMLRLATARPETLSFAFVLSLLLSIWTANAGVAALFDGLNVVYGEQEKRNFFVRRAVTFAFTCAAVVFVTAVTAILVAVPIALRMLGLGQSLLVPLRWLLLLILAAAAFAVMYRYGPSREHARWRWVRPGAAAAALAWVGGSLAFSWYINHLAHYDVTYGPLGAVVGFMTWIWVSVMVVLLGAELNAELEHQTAEDSTTGPPRPLGQRGAAMADTVGPAFIGVRKEAGLIWSMLQRQAGRVRRSPTPAHPPGPPAGPPGPRRRGAR